MHLIEVTNPFDPIKEHTVHSVPVSGVPTINKVLGASGLALDAPFIVFVNSDAVLRAGWDDPINPKAIILVLPAVEGGFSLLIFTVLITIVSVALSLMLTPALPVNPAAGSEADSVYTLRGQTNQVKLGEAIESAYGDGRHWPSYAAQSYNYYVNNNSWQNSLFVIGQGSCTIDAINIEDTLASEFEDIETQIVQPGGAVSLFRDNVQTSTEVGNVELYGTNEDDFDSDGFEVVVNDSGTLADTIAVDVVFSRGLYSQNDKGGLNNATITLRFDYKQIDDAGADVTAWTELFSISKTMATVTPQRFTRSGTVNPARYKVRGIRTNTASDSFKVGDTAIWESARAFLPNIGSYGDLTMLAVRARATANLNDNSARKINVEYRRKLRTWSPAGWAPATETRSIVWAFCDILTAPYGGNLSDDYLDLPALYELDQVLTSEGRFFDYVIDKSSSVWEALKLVASCARGVPMIDNGLITIIVDRLQTQVTHLFNAENIVFGTLKTSASFFKEEEFDSLEVEYRNPTTWKQEVVTCALAGSASENPDTMTLAGVTSRDLAFVDGMKIISDRKKRRREVTFRTGLEGFLATYNDLIRVEDDTFGLSANMGGDVLGIASDNVTITLSNDVTFVDGQEYTIRLRGIDGTIYGPYVVTAGSAANVVVSATSLAVEDILPLRDSDGFVNVVTHSPIYELGGGVSFAKNCVITHLEPGDDDTVAVTAVEYDPSVYDNDSGATTPGTGGTPSLIGSNALPVVSSITLTLLGEDLFRVIWIGDAEAEYYVIQISTDPTAFVGDSNEAWQTVATIYGQTYTDIPVGASVFYVRVAGVSALGQGPWVATGSQTTDDYFAALSLPTGTVTAGYDSLVITWGAQDDADYYEIFISETDPGGATPTVQATVETNSFTLTGLDGGAIRYFRVRSARVLPSGTIIYSSWASIFSGTTLARTPDNQSFFGPTEPSDPGILGAIWFDTDDDNRIYRWDGTDWVDAQKLIRAIDIGAGAVEADSVGANQIITQTANIADAVITDAKIANVTAGKITAGTITGQEIKIAGSGGSIESSNFVADTSGFQVLGTGEAEFNNVKIRGAATIEGAFQSGIILVDDGVYLARSDAITKLALPVVASSVTANSNTSPLIYIYGWDAVGANTANRVVKTSVVVTLSAFWSGRVDFLPLRLDGSIQKSVNGGSWATIATGRAGGAEYQSGQDSEWSGSGAFSVVVNVTFSSTDIVSFRFVGEAGDYCGLNSLAFNW